VREFNTWIVMIGDTTGMKEQPGPDMRRAMAGGIERVQARYPGRFAARGARRADVPATGAAPLTRADAEVDGEPENLGLAGRFQAHTKPMSLHMPETPSPALAAAAAGLPLVSARMADLPGPRSSIWVILRYLRDPMGVLSTLAREHGDPFMVKGKPSIVYTGDPAAIKAIYSADPDTFAPLNADFGVFLGSSSLILIAGAEHRQKRKLMTPPFHGARMRAYGEAMRRLTEQHTAQWTRGRTVGAYAVMQQISLDVILEAVFGVHDAKGRAELGKLLLELLEGFSPFIALFPWLRRSFGGIGPYARFMRRQRALYTRLDAMIAEARAAGPRDDILSLLVHARYEDGEPMTDAEIRDQLLLLVIAGHETTAITMAWALYALHRPENAEALARLRAELRALGPAPELEALAKLPYLDAVCQETMRRYPLAPAPSPRKLLRPFELMGHTLPAGMGVAPAMGIAHFREDVYPEPLRFLPERFLERKFTPFEHLPFGGGNRRCLGAAMAAYELRIVLGTIIQRFDLGAASLRPDPGKARAATVGPAHGVKLVVEE
jgi:cytochrome P450 family 110